MQYDARTSMILANLHQKLATLCKELPSCSYCGMLFLTSLARCKDPITGVELSPVISKYHAPSDEDVKSEGKPAFDAV